MGGTVPNGGSAFPAPANKLPGYFENQGMSLRDWFAGQALARLVSVDGPKLDTWEQVAAAAYDAADAMLAAREASR